MAVTKEKRREYAANRRARHGDGEVARQSREYYAKNRDKILARRRLAAETKKPQTRRTLWLWKLHSKYGITEAEYERMLLGQGGVCAICCGHAWKHKTKLSIDHCHRTGRVRGLLCDGCNKAIGLFADSPERLVRAAQYLGRGSAA